MGRKKRKLVDIDPSTDDAEKEADVSETEAIPPQEPSPAAKLPVAVVEPEITSAPASSSYAVTSHSAEIIGEDIYVSDGSCSEDEQGETAEILLAGSRMGLMRRGLFHPSLVQPNRQWQREQETVTNTEAEDEKREQELAKLDPAQRAARLLVEKLRKLEEAKDTARRVESGENAGRDPCLFSKRTAFDIRMDQIDDKPWEHGSGDVTDYFNYNFGEEDWLEYSQQQLQIRQELTDASKQRRAPDPTIVPVAPRTPKKQTPRVAVVGSSDNGDTVDEADVTTLHEHDEDGPVIGPVMVKKDDSMDVENEEDGKKEVDIKDIGKGGAWGAGAAPGSTLARLIEEQEAKEEAMALASSSEPNVSERGNDDDRDRNADDWSQRTDWRDRGDYGGGYQQQQQQQHQYAPPPYGGRRGGHFPPPAHHGGTLPLFYGGGRGRGYRPQPYPPPPWAARGRRGDFRGRHNDDYGGDRYMR